MKYNLNFWQEPDWQKENSVNIASLGALVALILVIAGVSHVIWILADISDRQDTLSMLEREIHQHKAVYGKVQSQADSIALWQETVKQLQVQSANRIVWSTQLNAIQNLVPEDIVLKNLLLDSTDLLPEVDKLKARPTAGKRLKHRHMTEYQLRVFGVAYGENAESIITDFSRRLPKHPEMKSYLQSVELTSVMPHNSRGSAAVLTGKEFVIVCHYKPVDWNRTNEG